MQFLKSMGASKTKINHFATLKLEEDELKPQQMEIIKPQLKKKIPIGFIPQKFALDYTPPCISILFNYEVMQYRDPTTKKLYHHKMKLKKMTSSSSIKDCLHYLKKKHHQYFASNNIDEQQLQSLIERLKKGLAAAEKYNNINEEDDFDYDFEDV